MACLRGGSSSTGRTTKLGDEETVVPPPRKLTRMSEKRSGKRKCNDQIEEQSTTLPKFIDNAARDKFELITQKGFITQRTILPSKFCKLDLESVLKFFEFQK